MKFDQAAHELAGYIPETSPATNERNPPVMPDTRTRVLRQHGRSVVKVEGALYDMTDVWKLAQTSTECFIQSRLLYKSQSDGRRQPYSGDLLAFATKSESIVSVHTKDGHMLLFGHDLVSRAMRKGVRVVKCRVIDLLDLKQLKVVLPLGASFSDYEGH